MDKIAKVMGEFKRGSLHSGSKEGPKVKSKKQAQAIALSEAGKSKKGSSGHRRKIQKAAFANAKQRTGGY